MIRRLTISLMCSTLLSSLLFSQKVYDYDQFMQQVSSYHPLMKQAQLRTVIGEAVLLEAKATNDPYVQASYGDKAYDGNDYYEKSEIKFAIPTAIGLEVFTSYSENTGPRVNPELLTSASGQYQAGVSLPIGSRLFFNERQMTIRQSELMLNAAEEEKRKIINDLLYRANIAYVNLSLASEMLVVQENAIGVAERQFEFIKELFYQGDRPAIDTVEAFLQVQNRRFRLLEAQNELNSARLILSTFLWDENSDPIALAEGYIGEGLNLITSRLEVIEDSFVVWNETLQETHPDLRIARLDLRSLKYERRTATSELFPQIDLKYAMLTPGISNRDIDAIGMDDRMVGIGLKYPLLLRKQRSRLNLVDAQTLDKTLDLNMKEIALKARLNESIYAYGIISEQNTLYTAMTNNYNRLLEAEKTKFEIGESSVFLLNSRENSLFQAQIKRLETSAKQAVSALNVIQTANSENAFIQLLN